MTERLEQSNTNLSKLNMTELHQFLNYASKYKLILRGKNKYTKWCNIWVWIRIFKKKFNTNTE